MKKTFFTLIALTMPCLCLASGDVTDQLLMAMKTYKVPVVGYAIIDHYKIVDAKTVSLNKALKTSNNTLFQAASISKSVTAYAALSLAGENKIQLNNPANEYLNAWKIPDNQFTKHHPVKVVNLMDMTSGASVSGFAGYKDGKKLPSNVELLNGVAPANNLPVRIIYVPGSKYFYSGGAFQILQEIISHVSKQSFVKFMNGTVLKKLQMHNSIYQYPLTNKRLRLLAVPGFDGWSGKEIPGGWHNYACLGACGMWSTPIDLAKFALNITSSYLGSPHGLISKNLARKMLTRQKNTSFGLGVVVSAKSNNLYFWKAGHNYGYHSLLIMFPNRGKGLVIMTNSETGDVVINYITAVIAHEYHWPYYFPFLDELIKSPDY